MPDMRKTGPARRGAASLLFLGLLVPGCAELSFNQIQLGQEPRDYRRALPEERSRRSPTGMCYLEHDPGAGRVDAMVVLLTPDGRVAGKLHASEVEQRWNWPAQTTFTLRGELDPALIRMAGAGPVDTLRAVADELTAADMDAFTRDAHAWVAAGLVRLVQHWPHVGDEGPAVTRLAGMLDRVPAGGTAQIVVGVDGRYSIAYVHVSPH
jgi:hypothetical protein